jgi:hypothetical protein
MNLNIKYGSSVAALVLTDVVCEHTNSNKINRKVARTLNQFNIRANYIETSCNDVVKKLESTIVFYELLVKDYIHRCDTIFHNEADIKVNSFIKNVIKARYKAWLDKNLKIHKQYTRRK